MREHVCRCVVIDAETGDRFPCCRPIPLDAPFCPECETRHPGMARAGAVVDVVPLAGE